MRNWLFAVVVGIAGVIGTADPASAENWGTGPVRQHFQAQPSSYAYPTANPSGYYTSTYHSAWGYPWFAYYNYSHANRDYSQLLPMMEAHGAATYGSNGHDYRNHSSGYGYGGYYGGMSGYSGSAMPTNEAAPVSAPASPAPDTGCAGTVSVTLPADAKLLFNGKLAVGSGTVRTFETPLLARGQAYGYDLTVEVIRDGKVQSHTEKVVVRAGEKSRVAFPMDLVRTASAK